MLEGSKILIENLAIAVEMATAALIGFAVLEALWRAVPLFIRRAGRPDHKIEVRLGLGRWLALSLEFALAADILRTAVAPSWDDIGKLAAIATLRTALNYFLERETREEVTAGVSLTERSSISEAGSVTIGVGPFTAR